MTQNAITQNAITLSVLAQIVHSNDQVSRFAIIAYLSFNLI